MGLEFAVLGGVSASRDGEPIDLGGRRQRAVLALLVVARGAVVPAERLIGALWPDEPPPKPQSALQAYVSHLRRALEPDRPARARTGLIVSLPAGYALRVDVDAVDAWRFEQAVKRGDPDGLESALHLWRGDPYADYPEAPWAVAERTRLGELRSAARETLAGVRLERGDTGPLIAELEAMVDDEPLREQRWQLLALALYRAHRQADALRALRRARESLRDELGVDPGPALRALEADILAQAPSLTAQSLAAPATAASATSASAGPAAGAEAWAGAGAGVSALTEGVALVPPPALFGRADVLARLRDASAPLTLVTGDAGSGKSAVLTALDRHRRSQGWRVAWGHCPEVDGAPALWPWVELLRALPGADDVPELRPLLVDDSAPADVDPATLRFRLRHAATTFLRTLAAECPLLLILDDAHRADQATLDLLCHLLGNLHGAAVTTVVAYRDGEVAGPLESALAKVARHHPARVPLGALPAEAVEALVRAAAARPLDDLAVANAVRRSDGNPFYARELGLLLGTTEAPAVPAGVLDVVRHRVSLLPAPGPTVLKLAAVVGREVDLDVLLELLQDTGVDEDDVLDAVDAALVAGLLEADGDRLRFSHLLTRDALYHQISPPRRSRWHGLVAEAVSRVRPDDVAALARHYALAGPGHSAAAASAAGRAASQAESRSAYTEAARLWRQAADAAATAGSPARDRVALLLSLCRALTTQGARAEAVVARGEAIALARAAANPALLGTAMTAWAVPTLWLQGRFRHHDPALVAEVSALLASSADDDDRCRLLCALVNESEDPAAGISAARRRELADEAVALAGRSGDPDLIGLATAAALRTSYFGVPLERRRDLARTALDVGRRSGRVLLALLGEQASAQVAAATGDVDAFDRHRRAADEMTSQLHLGAARLVGIAALGLRHSLAGRFAQADAAYSELADAITAAGGNGGPLLGFAARVGVAEARGEDALAALAGELPTLAEFGRIAHEPQARILLAAGRLDEARSIWRPDEELPPDFLAPGWYACRITTAIAFDEPAVVRATYRTLRPYQDQLCGGITGTLTFAPVAQYLGDAARYLGDAEAAAAHYAAAEVLARRAGAQHYLDRALASVRMAG